MGLYNASPAYITYGTDDKSTKVVYPEPDQIPQHLPKFFLFTKKGLTDPKLTTAASKTVIYGDETFDKHSPYYNHATKFCTGIVGEGNSVIIQRVLPDDAGAPANIRLYIDVLDVPDMKAYKRNADGSIKLDATTGKPVEDTDAGTFAGVKYKFIAEPVADEDIGKGASKPGTMDGSIMYPIMDLKAKYQGEYYNNIGISFTVLSKDKVGSRLLTEAKAMPFGISVVNRKDKNSSPKNVPTLFDTDYAVFSFKPGAINPYTEEAMGLETVFPDQWANETDPAAPLVYSDFEDPILYTANIENVISHMAEVEAPLIKDEIVTIDGMTVNKLSWFDFSKADVDTIKNEEKYLINFLTGKSLSNVPYNAIVYDTEPATTLADGQKEIQMTTKTPIFLQGGSDGTLSAEQFNKAVEAELDKYLDPNSKVQELATHPESIVYETGFPLETKKKFGKVLSLRKDVAVAATTIDVSNPVPMSIADERAVAVVLRTAFRLYPESDRFGTPTMRAWVVMGDGTEIDGSERLPQLYDLALKFARYMGAGNGRWKSGRDFDIGSQSIIKSLKDLKPDFIPAGVKPTLWREGLIWSQPYDLKSYHFPAIQTIYPDDTSVLNSPITVMAICTLEKVAAEAQRNFTGDSRMTRSVFADKVLAFVQDRLKDRFDNRFVISTDVFFTKGDKAKGYSWHLVNKIYAANLKTTMFYNTQSYRLDDLK